MREIISFINDVKYRITLLTFWFMPKKFQALNKEKKIIDICFKLSTAYNIALVLPLISTCSFHCFCLLCFLICRCLGWACGLYSVLPLALMNIETERRWSIFLPRFSFDAMLPSHVCAKNLFRTLKRNLSFLRCATFCGWPAFLDMSEDLLSFW